MRWHLLLVWSRLVTGSFNLDGNKNITYTPRRLTEQCNKIECMPRCGGRLGTGNVSLFICLPRRADKVSTRKGAGGAGERGAGGSVGRDSDSSSCCIKRLKRNTKPSTFPLPLATFSIAPSLLHFHFRNIYAKAENGMETVCRPRNFPPNSNDKSRKITVYRLIDTL